MKTITLPKNHSVYTHTHTHAHANELLTICLGRGSLLTLSPLILY